MFNVFSCIILALIKTFNIQNRCLRNDNCYFVQLIKEDEDETIVLNVSVSI